jgi:hypothetical protein
MRYVRSAWLSLLAATLVVPTAAQPIAQNADHADAAARAGTAAYLGVFAASAGCEAITGVPYELVFGPDGDLYIPSWYGFPGLGRVCAFDGTTGAEIGEFVDAGSGGYGFTDGIAFSPLTGDLYVFSDPSGTTDPGEILRFDGTTGTFVGVFNADVPYTGSLAFNETGSILYLTTVETDGRVLAYDGSSGAFIDTIAGPGDGLIFASGGEVGPDGALYVANWFAENVLRVTPGGGVSVFVASGTGGLSRPTSLAFGPDGHLYVSHGSPGEVLRFDGTSGAFIDEYASGPEMGCAEGLAFGTDGDLFVGIACPPNNNAVLRYEGPGTGCAQELAATLDDDTPSPGQTITFTVTVTNGDAGPAPLDLWLDATGPVSQRILLASGTVPGGATVTRAVRLRIPGNAPGGSYDADLHIGDFDTDDVCDTVAFSVTISAPRTGGTGPAAFEAFSEGDFSVAAAASVPPLQPVPNPFRGQTTIRFEVAEAAFVRLVVHDMLGREVAVLVDGLLEAGAHAATFDARGLAPGTYVYRLVAGGAVHTCRLTLTR